MIKKLIVINICTWFFLVLVAQKYFFPPDIIFKFFGLHLDSILSKFFIWQFITYMFVHGSGVFHIIFNMFVLWMFGSELEKLWGSRFFLIYYLFCGIGAGVLYFLSVCLFVFAFGLDPSILQIPVVGASGAIFGLLLAYGYVYGERIVYFLMIFPMKARTFTFLIAGIELLNILERGFASPVANLAHLGGLVSGLLFFVFWKFWQRWFLSRLKDKIYLKFLKLKLKYKKLF